MHVAGATSGMQVILKIVKLAGNQFWLLPVNAPIPAATCTPKGDRWI